MAAHDDPDFDLAFSVAQTKVREAMEALSHLATLAQEEGVPAHLSPLAVQIGSLGASIATQMNAVNVAVRMERKRQE